MINPLLVYGGWLVIGYCMNELFRDWVDEWRMARWRAMTHTSPYLQEREQ